MMASRNYFILTLLVAILASCGEETQLKDGDTIFFPDTAAFRQSWVMQEHVMLTELFERDTLYNQLDLDTLELTHSMCDCPDWIDKTKGDIDCKECTDFYIEAADPSLEFPEEFGMTGTTVRFYGVLLPGMNLPQGRTFYTSDPVPWTVMRYYGYEVIRPYKILGPKWKYFQSPGDTVESFTELMIQ